MAEANVTQFKLQALVATKKEEAQTLETAYNEMVTMSKELAIAKEQVATLQKEHDYLKGLEVECDQVSKLLRKNAWEKRSLIDIVTEYRDDELTKRKALEDEIAALKK